MTATGGRSSREKGAKAERALVAYLVELGLEAKRTASGYHQDGGDIYWPSSPYVVDVKHQERVRLPEWWREVADEALELHRRPVLVLRRPNAPNPAGWAALELAEAPSEADAVVESQRVRFWHEWNRTDAAALLIALEDGATWLRAVSVEAWITTHLATLEAPNE
ncbi:MAG: hypothetical protein ACF8PN_05025 [Phycisphaerales bacterium]